jgi:hypothetical protein
MMPHSMAEMISLVLDNHQLDVNAIDETGQSLLGMLTYMLQHMFYGVLPIFRSSSSVLIRTSQ